ncbi:polyhydroxyalkanoate depolymerase [Xylophilus sp. GOD-11R]|uniref:polyhydroxyalkanoate depolymerase n=1 Tax=Xylophilus sp. GOD-11R TaxID=3089814 RepID=UPI00298D4A56|nr:polyhydroxyalkanoate depolymerase [Xylophilus sp. GOD-11R]WPB58446.1 polyhydroxyalkanoate depolymerase [Xylophilus sp. GOD-11R]
MLYQIYEAQRALMEPFADFANAASKMFGNSLNPVNQLPGAQRLAATYDLMYRLGKDYEKPAFGIQTVMVDDTEVVIHEAIELDKPFCELRRFKRFTDDSEVLAKLKAQPAVLVVAPLSGHYATLLRDTVKTMLQDHKVYVTDWKNARTVPLTDGDFHLDDYVNYVQDFIRHLQGIYGNCHVISVCQPTVPVLAAVSLMASRGETTPLSMTMMGGPINAKKSPTAVNNLAMNKSYEWFENNVIFRVPPGFPGEGRMVYPGFLQHTGFVAMNPDRHLSSHYDYFKNLMKGDDASAEAHRKFYDEYNAVLDMDAKYYLETIRVVFQDFCLVNGNWDVRNPQGVEERVKPADIRTTAVLTVEGELDDISGSGQTEAAHELCTSVPASMQKHVEVKGAGHYGIFSGRRWRDLTYPAVRDFILKYEPQPQAVTIQTVSVQPHLPTMEEPAATTPSPAAAAAKSEAKPQAAAEAKHVTAPPAKAARAVAKSAATAPARKASAKTTAKTVAKTVPRAAAKVAEKPAAKPVAKTSRARKPAPVDTSIASA